MRKILLGILLLFSLSATSTHLVGGNITWQCLGQNQYVFTLNLYKDCGPVTAVLPDSAIIFGTPDTFWVYRESIIDLTIPCNGDTTIGCANGNRNGIEHHIYVSDTVALPGKPPAAGWKFSYSNYARTSAVVNLVNANQYGVIIRSLMFADAAGGCNSSPYYDFNASQQIIRINNSLSTLAQSNNASDSLYYDFVNPSDPSGALPFEPGYSASSPFPNTATHASNGPMSINHNNGLIDFDCNVGTQGLYAYAVEVQQWREGQLLSKIIVENSVQGNFGTLSNSAPLAYIDTALYDLERQGNVYRKQVRVGDTVQFNIKATDSDINSLTSQIQQISFQADGYALDGQWGAQNSFVQDAQITPVAPQSGYVSSNTNEVQFNWVLGPEHCNSAVNKHIFHFQFSDDECPYVGMSHIIFELEVSRHVYIKEDTLRACGGDSVQLKGVTASRKYLWYPTGDTIPNPMLVPVTSGYNVLTDPLNPGYADSVFVEIQQPDIFTLDTINGKFQLIDSNATANRVWYYNGVPFYYPYDTLSSLGFGDYWVEATKGLCHFVSDTIHIAFGSSFSVFDPNNGGYSGVDSAFSGSMGATFSINQNATINSVTIIGLEDLHKSGTGYDLNVKVYDANQVEVFSKDVTLTPPFFGPLHIEVGYSLTANADYTIAVSGDTAYSFKVFENVSYPATPHNNGITVKGAYEGAAGQFPTQPSNYLLPFTINTDVQVVSVSEHPAGTFEIYPNPASDVITISGFENNASVQLFDLHGKAIKAYNVNESSLVVRRDGLAAGVYLLHIKEGVKSEVLKVTFR